MQTRFAFWPPGWVCLKHGLQRRSRWRDDARAGAGARAKLGPRHLAPTAEPTIAPEPGPEHQGGPGWGALLGDRYRDLGPLGVGAMGEVRRVYDRQLRRVVAMKTLRSRLLENPAVISRFIEEAEVTAQLQHPGIIPIHDRGVLPDGRVWFTMREIDGRSYFEAIRDHHRTSGNRSKTSSESPASDRGASPGLCRGRACPRARGGASRPQAQNIMVGSSGEILVVDWGLARVGRSDGDGAAEASVDSTRSARRAFLTQMGRVAGTPAYGPRAGRGAPTRLTAERCVFARGDLVRHPARAHTISGRQPG